ncbi:MAG TPA: carboxypeptidase-like regulatory domain-containing protein [Gemmatimonadaceae bacterium]|nr:carboxypeptidase-like regulatory domain-containing protein [Gemmatimonadaceae bacterium]
MGSATVLILANLLCAVPPARAQQTLLARAPTTAALVGQVVAEATHQPLGNAVVVVTGMRGVTARDSARTDSAGRFDIDGLTGTTYRLRIRRLGYAEFDAIILVTPSDTTTRVFQLGASAVALPGVTVTGHSAVEPRMLGFERRRAKGTGRFLTRAQLDHDQGRKFSDVLRQLSAELMPTRAGDGRTTYLMNREQQAPEAFIHQPVPCLVQIYLDGVRIYEGGRADPIMDPPPDINDFKPGSLEGVEFYATPSATPVEFRSGNAECGTLVLWSRGGSR